ncbi:hypothetical protein [Nonomuraea sp. SYSU D8015]|uniref:hypothetical protein n=1 Tax=Nonomuraea sp. SYSU D8015 TaxID=2593644 RepID=UPI0016601267|nr:hypothetical protein [Nonomuraea sp. SYSU D8015]
MASKKSRRWRSRLDEGHALRMEIGDVARAAAAPGWSRLTVRRAQVGAYALTTVTCDGREIAAAGMDEPFQRLRELSYKADAGTWFTCELAFSPGSRGYTGRVCSAAAPFEDVPAPAALAELTTFPREEPPGWLLAALPTAPPIGLPTTYGDHYDRWAAHHGDGRPPPPIDGELAYVPATTMTARTFHHDQESGHHSLYLMERTDEPEAGYFTVSRYEDAYWIGRHSMHSTNTGVRSITLDGALLRLELTPEAADGLATETAFEVRLDLPPENIGRLRAVLPGMLRPVTQGPELIGF